MAVDPRVMDARGGGGKGKSISPGARVRNVFGTVGEVISAFTTVNRFRLSAILVWFIGVYTTSIVIQQGWTRLPATDVGNLLGQFYGNAFIGAILLEFIFTTFTSPIVTKKSLHPLSIFVLFVNMGINSIVTLPISRGLVDSGAWANMIGALNTFSTVAIKVSIDNINRDVVVYTLMLIMAFALAIGSEVLWHMGAPRRDA